MPGSKRSNTKLSKMSAAFVENSPLLKSFLARFFSNRQDIEDVAQEAYLRSYVAEQRQLIENPKAFLFRVAKNIALTELSKKSKQITNCLEESGISELLATEASADDEAQADEQLGLYCIAVAALPHKCREVFLLRKVHGLSHKEIAEHMSLSASSVEKYLTRGMAACIGVHDREEQHRMGIGARGNLRTRRLEKQ